MDNLLTTRQVQDKLKVDRITIYRMLQDGRLRGVKIGQQWRFPEKEIERLLSGGAVAEPEAAVTVGVQAFPTHCVQTIQNLLVEIGQLGAVVVDTEGNPLTEVSTTCAFCKLLLANPTARLACQESWRDAALAGEQSGPATCHAGLNYLRAPIYEGDVIVGYILVGQVHLQPCDADSSRQAVEKIIAKYGLDAGPVNAAAEQITCVAEAQKPFIQEWPGKASKAVEAILSERSGFIDRLQRIAQMSRMDLK